MVHVCPGDFHRDDRDGSHEPFRSKEFQPDVCRDDMLSSKIDLPCVSCVKPNQFGGSTTWSRASLFGASHFHPGDGANDCNMIMWPGSILVADLGVARLRKLKLYCKIEIWKHAKVHPRTVYSLTWDRQTKECWRWHWYSRFRRPDSRNNQRMKAAIQDIACLEPTKRHSVLRKPQRDE